MNKIKVKKIKLYLYRKFAIKKLAKKIANKKGRKLKINTMKTQYRLISKFIFE